MADEVKKNQDEIVENAADIREGVVSDDAVETVAGGTVMWVDENGKQISPPENAPRPSVRREHSTYDAKRPR